MKKSKKTESLTEEELVKLKNIDENGKNLISRITQHRLNEIEIDHQLDSLEERKKDSERLRIELTSEYVSHKVIEEKFKKEMVEKYGKINVKNSGEIVKV